MISYGDYGAVTKTQFLYCKVDWKDRTQMITRNLLNQIEMSIKIMKHNIFDVVNDTVVIRKLTTLADYLKFELNTKSGITDSDILDDKEFQGYISDLWRPASFTGYYNPNLNKAETKIIYDTQHLIKRISRRIEKHGQYQVKSR